MIPYIKEYLLKNWENLKLGQRPNDLLFIKFEDRLIRSQDVSIITFLVKKIIDNSEIPSLIVKIPRYPENPYANLTLKNEYNNLIKVQEKINNIQIINTMPKIIFMVTINNSLILAENFLSGSDMGSTILNNDIPKTFIDNFGLASSWLINFQTSYGGRTIKLGDFMINYAEKIINDYIVNFPEKSSSHNAFFKNIINACEKSCDKEIVIFPQQTDYHASNILLNNGKVSGVIDWEDFEEFGLPCFDLFHFITTYHEGLYNYFCKTGYWEGIDKLSNDPEWLTILNNAISKFYLVPLNIDPELVHIFIALYAIKCVLIAGSSRKEALAILPIKEYMLSLNPSSLSDLLVSITIIYFNRLRRKAIANNKKDLADLFNSKIIAAHNKRG